MERIELTSKDYEAQFASLQNVKSMLQTRFWDSPPKAFVHSYGCQQNVSDGEKMMGLLSEMGYVFTTEREEADFILFNTCAVRENAEFRIYGNVGNLKKLKEKNKNLIIALAGCMMQQEHVAAKIKESYPYVDLILGTHAAHLLPGMIEKSLSGQKHVEETENHDGFIVEDLPIRRDGTLKAWVPIMYGCDNFCTFCVVPYVRGRERSRRPEKILADICALVEEGYKEIMLLGQNVNSYGKGLAQPLRFAELLRRIDEIPGDFRIRFMTSHPKDCTKELIDTIANSEKICRHIHLPVQSGSDEVLQQMNRRYTAAQYLDLIAYAREKMPDVRLSSDIIVGFPGESREDFLKTLELLQQVEYDFLFTFVYSKRVGTKAEKMDDPVSSEEKSRWMRELLALQSELSAKRFRQMIGSTVRVLVDSEGKKDTGRLAGKSDGNITVEFYGPAKIGTFVFVKITESYNWGVIGELLP